jgi:hypothetical protein
VLLDGCEADDRGRLIEQRGLEPAPDGSTLGREHQGLDPPVAYCDAALDEALGLEPVDDAGDVRRVAPQPARQLAHGDRIVRIEAAQRHRLRW